MHKLTSRRWWGLYALCFACLLLISPLHVSVIFPLRKGSNASFSADMFGAISPSQVQSLDLNGDGAVECIRLNKGVLSIDDCADASVNVFWQSDAAWKVEQWMLSDLNSDGKPEITLLVWRPFAPWPIEREAPDGGRIGTFHDARGQSCHVILIGWRKDGFKELWAGSALVDPILTILPADIDGDGMQELVTIEGKYSQPAIFRNGPVAIWKWNGFGFDLNRRVEGSFRHFVLFDPPDTYIIASQ